MNRWFFCPLILFAVLMTAVPAAHGQTTAPLTTLLEIAPDGEARRNSEGDILPLKNGRLALVYSRFVEGSSDHARAHLAMRTSADGGKSWSADHQLLENEGGKNVMSVSLRRGQNGDVLLFYLRKDSSATSCSMYVRRSHDELETLGEPVLVTTLPGYHVVNNDRVLRLGSGRLLVPAALHTDPNDILSTETRFNAAAALTCYYSDDDGRTWQRDQSVIPPLDQRPIVFQEPGLVELSDGRVMMIIRTNQKAQWASYSSDGGITWTKPTATALASPLSPATIEAVPGTSSTLAAIWNDHTGRWPFRTDEDWRNPLCLALSHDDGKTWEPSRRLESAPEGWYCYTSMTWTNDRLLLTYCAGKERKDGLNTLKVSALPISLVR